MEKPNETASGLLAFTLHAHLPYVVNHGTWPHGMEWLHEAAAETYLPLLRVIGNLQRDGIVANLNISISPVLLEQLAHPVFQAEFPKYVTRKIVAAREDEAYFIQSGDAHLAETARFWHRFFTGALEDFKALGGEIIRGFRQFEEAGLIEILTSGATHGYLPLLGTDESVRAQVRTAVATHMRHLGRAPKGIWSPECGYRPAGRWRYPVADAGTGESHPEFERIGVEQALAESGLKFFIVDTHLVEQSDQVFSPYKNVHLSVPHEAPRERSSSTPGRNLYRPYFVEGNAAASSRLKETIIFPRDPRTGLQVWSGDIGYPGDSNYLDFHKKRFPGGHRYWQVTGANVDMGDKMPYFPQQAAERVKEHANHFVGLVYEALEQNLDPRSPPVLCAPFDAELFGHWWFEGPMWLEAVCRTMHYHDSQLATTTLSGYLAKYSPGERIAMHEGSWGAQGNNSVWLNTDTSWTYSQIYPAEIYTREVATQGAWRKSEMGRRIVRQLCRELLLLESSDWQFLITTGAARDYAETRFVTHHDQFLELKAMWETYEKNGALTEQSSVRLGEIEVRDGLFPDIDPGLWALGAHQ